MQGRFNMNYYMSRNIDGEFDAAVERVTAALKDEGFGVLTEIDVKATLKKKIDVDFRKYKILGACNPPFAHRALLAEDKIGVMLPCNVIVQELETGGLEVFAMDPVGAMAGIDNPVIEELAGEVSEKLARVLEAL